MADSYYVYLKYHASLQSSLIMIFGDLVTICHLGNRLRKICFVNVTDRTIKRTVTENFFQIIPHASPKKNVEKIDDQYKILFANIYKNDHFKKKEL